MKQFSKILTLILLSSLFLNNLFGQEDSFKNDPVANNPNDYPKFRLGVSFSPNISWFKSNTAGYKNEGSKVGFTYGLSTEFFLGKNYLFSTGLFIANLRGELSYEGIYENNNKVNFSSAVKQTYSIEYIEIPLTLKLRTNEIGYMTYYGQFGLKAGVKFKSTSDYSYTDINNSPKVEGRNTASDLFFINTYLVIGAGVEYNVSGNTSVVLGLTFNNGFINQLDRKYNVVDASGNALIDSDGNPVLSSKDASANLNYVALNIAVYF